MESGNAIRVFVGNELQMQYYYEVFNSFSI